MTEVELKGIHHVCIVIGTKCLFLLSLVSIFIQIGRKQQP